MANFIYGKAKESLLKGEINVNSNQIKLLLINNTLYTPSQNVDQYVSDIDPLAIRWRSEQLLNISTTLGVLDADNVPISNYTGESFESIIGYQLGTTDANSRLIFYIDSGLRTAI